MLFLILLKVILAIILCGISIPLILRFLIFRKPIEKLAAKVITIFWYIINFLSSLILGNTNLWLHYLIFAVTFSSYFILRSGSKKFFTSQDQNSNSNSDLEHNPESKIQKNFSFWENN